MTLQVGAPFDGREHPWPEMTHYGWDPGHAPAAHHRLTVFAARPSGAERVAFSSGGRIELALIVDGPALVVCWRGAGWPTWSDGHFAWHLLPESRRALPGVDIPEGAAVPLDLVLVDAADGRVAAIRRIAMPAGFARPLHAAIRAQAEAPWDQRAYDARATELAALAPDVLARRAIVRYSVGGGR